MQSLLKISQQTAWQLIGKIVSSLSTFIVLGLITRNFGETGTGTYTLAVTYLAMFFLLADFGFNAHILKKTHNLKLAGKDEWNKLLGVRILWSVFLVVAALVLLPIWPFTSTDFARSVMMGSLAIVAYAVYVTGNAVFQSGLRYDLSTVAVVSGSLVWLLIVFWFLKLKLGIPYLLLSHFLSWLVITSVTLIVLKKLIKNVSAVFDLKYARSLFKDSWPIAATLALNVVYFRADAFILSSIKGSAQVGIYNVAYLVFQTILVLPTFMMNSFYPMMLETLKFRVDRFKYQIKMATLGLAVISVILSFATFISSPHIIKLITGSGFVGSVTSLRILSFGFPAYFLSALLMWILVTSGKYKTLLLIYTSGLIINLALNFILIPQFSFYGASVTTVISEYLILLLLLASLRV